MEVATNSSGNSTKVKNGKFDRSVDLECFGGLLGNSLKKIRLDECLPSSVLNEYRSYALLPGDISYAFKCGETVICKFVCDGNGELFYPSFYNCVEKEDCMFQRLSKDACLFLRFDLASHIVSYLTHGHFYIEDSTVEISTDVSEMSFIQKEKYIICYLGSFVFGTLSRRLRNSKKWQTKTIQDSLSILTAGKSSSEHRDQTLVAVRDRGGLWKVRPAVCRIFSIVELMFKSNCVGFIRSIDTKKMVSHLLTNTEFLANYSTVCNDTAAKVEKEVASNLLEKMLTLYVRLRAFSYAKDKVQHHKIVAKKIKTRSLRTEIKKASLNLDKGH